METWINFSATLGGDISCSLREATCKEEAIVCYRGYQEFQPIYSCPLREVKFLIAASVSAHKLRQYLIDRGLIEGTETSRDELRKSILRSTGKKYFEECSSVTVDNLNQDMIKRDKEAIALAQKKAGQKSLSTSPQRPETTFSPLTRVMGLPSAFGQSAWVNPLYN